ncbi:sugar phosphate nucleotidyltransferase [Gammaproteobacteria bacterium]|nr:sugar phosphate nucleotidyltransferase [Gammaproteobacteria bacterium]
MTSKNFRPIILAGGSGKRLWPLSTKEKPKQFLPLFGDLSLFDLTLQRVNNRDLFNKPVVVTSEEYLLLVEESLKKTGIEVQRIILEPESKNTFPAIALSVLSSLYENENERYLVMPSDHYIPYNKSFYEACSSIKNQFNFEGLTLMGVNPDSPSTEYGYISVKAANDELKRVESFIEKPDIEKAKLLLKQPNTLWNAGIFSFEGKWFCDSIESTKPETNNILKDLLSSFNAKQIYFYPNKKKFSYLENISFDKAFVESNNENYVVNLDAGWTDLGSWYALSNLQKNPEHGLTLYSKEKFVRTDKPWGYFEVLLETDSSKVKILSISPYQKLSLQMHEHRSETWYVTQGIATVTKDEKLIKLYPGESIIIDKNEKHRLENLGDEVLELIEIQTGTYFGEDDIIRLDDIYGRKDFH